MSEEARKQKSITADMSNEYDIDIVSWNWYQNNADGQDGYSRLRRGNAILYDIPVTPANVLFAIMIKYRLYLFSQTRVDIDISTYDNRDISTIKFKKAHTANVSLTRTELEVLKIFGITAKSVEEMVETYIKYKHFTGEPLQNAINLFAYECKLCKEIMFGMSIKILNNHMKKHGEHIEKIADSHLDIGDCFKNNRIFDYTTTEGKCILCEADYGLPIKNIPFETFMSHMIKVHTKEEEYEWMMDKINVIIERNLKSDNHRRYGYESFTYDSNDEKKYMHLYSG